ncbi:peptidyl-tRNA hydrolase II domain-containing protein [Fimicolochytrium jonesii]|uniref:peptidyl-tRNA hydrolase II domain-containing protein n=1 Tax=Fimicolochytrium jonesii TaxID=1396493 RepID=UPI0022FDDFA1|nr:peptidyl-tRNA hydrolase II domain-containing protein [Fimicolochytrium jonesii]KAI8821664.1 peptidyl-tRNA hydrolase II domain-containing protein [Fimicolochytrium jonesii]
MSTGPVSEVAETEPASASNATTTADGEPLTMYLFVRKDLESDLNWPSGSVITQACHASMAVMHKNSRDPAVLEYLNDLERMHKVTFAARDPAHLTKIRTALTTHSKVFHEWIEQPEGIPTCIATMPYRRSEMREVMKRCRVSLYK